MIPWSLLDVAQVPGGNGELRLMQRGTEFSIRLGQNELMNSRHSGSEEALGTRLASELKPQSASDIDRRVGYGLHASRRACRARTRGPNCRRRTGPGRFGMGPGFDGGGLRYKPEGSARKDPRSQMSAT